MEVTCHNEASDMSPTHFLYLRNSGFVIRSKQLLNNAINKKSVILILGGEEKYTFSSVMKNADEMTHVCNIATVLSVCVLEIDNAQQRNFPLYEIR